MMKRTFKSLAALLAVAAALSLCALEAQAQTYGAHTPSLPNYVTGGATSNLSVVINLNYNRNLGLTVSGTTYTQTNSTLTVTMVQSVDGNNYETATSRAVALTIPTNSVAALTTNLDFGGVGWVKITGIAAGNNAVTNPGVVYSLKPGQ